MQALTSENKKESTKVNVLGLFQEYVSAIRYPYGSRTPSFLLAVDFAHRYNNVRDRAREEISHCRTICL